jgi:hypothetical protein
MSDYDRDLMIAKRQLMTNISRLSAAVAEGKNVTSAMDELSQSIDDLNKSWDELTDALVRQRTVRNEEILKLLDLIAELTKERRP